MLSTAGYHDAPGVQRPRRVSHPLSTYADPPDSRRLQSSPHPQRSFVPNSAFNFEFRLPDNALGATKSPDNVPNRNDESFNFSLPFRDNYSQNPYPPAPLQIPVQGDPANQSPTAYLHSATSNFTSQSLSDYPSLHSDSRSLTPSPLERAVWTENPSAGLESRPTNIPFSVGLQPPQSSLHSSVPSETQLSDAQQGPVFVSGASEAGSSGTPDGSRSRIGPNGLAEDQPPTAQGKMRTRVYVACLQCRSRKIRCDGGKPKCLKCTRRSSDCQYDAAPKRRGPDKKPGARQRTSKKAKVAAEVMAKDGTAPEARTSAVGGSDEDREERGDVKRRKKASNAGLTWSVGGGNVNDRPESAATTSIAAVPSSVVPSSSQGLSVTFRSLPGHPLHTFTESRLHLPVSQNKLDFSLESTPISNVGRAHTRVMENQSAVQSRLHPYFGSTSFSDSYFPHAHIQAIGEDEQQGDRDVERKSDEIASEPSLEFTRKTWWDSLLVTYSPAADRAKTALEIQSDLQFLFKASNYFLSFFNAPLFFSIFCNPVEREQMQPSLILASLALSTFMRSSEIGLGNAGRIRALWLRDAAQSALEASFNARWVDPTLGQAAFLLALFEICAHPQHSSERCSSSMLLLDSIIRALGLTKLDTDDPNASVFTPRTVPAITASSVARQEGCSCDSLTLGKNSRSSQTHTPLWVATAAWNPDWTVAEIRKDESRRLCWSTLHLTAGHTAHASAFALPTLDFYSVQPANYALLFPGESLMQGKSSHVQHSPKETVWALYSRAMLLWNSCLRMRAGDVSDDERAVFAVGAWLESTAIEEALDAHTCSCDQAFMYQGREFLFITRMCITYEFSRFVPHPESDVNGLFSRKKAMAWLVRQGNVAKRIMNGLHTVTGHKNNILAQRPFFVWWFMSLVGRCLMLFSMDRSLLIALEVAQAFLPPIEYLSSLWPCPAQRERYLALHGRLTQACRSAQVLPPPPPNVDILAPGSPPVNVI